MAKLQDLPPEILEQVFSNLDYLTLKIGIRGSCRRFNYMIAHAPPLLRGALYQHKLPTVFQYDLTYDEEYSRYNNIAHNIGAKNLGVPFYWTHPLDGEQYCFELHPCIGLLKTTNVGTNSEGNFDWDEVGFYNSKNGKFIPLLSTGLADESALSEDYRLTNPFLETITPQQAPLVITSAPDTLLKRLTVRSFIAQLAKEVAMDGSMSYDKSTYKSTYRAIVSGRSQRDTTCEIGGYRTCARWENFLCDIDADGVKNTEIVKILSWVKEPKDCTYKALYEYTRGERSRGP